MSFHMLESAAHHIPVMEMLALCRTDFRVTAVILTIAAVVVRGKVTIVAMGAMALDGTPWRNPSPASSNQTGPALSLAIGKQRLSCGKAVSFANIGTMRARVTSLSFAKIVVGRKVKTHCRVSAIIVAVAAVVMSSPVTILAMSET
jgi:hypothetical protein